MNHIKCPTFAFIFYFDSTTVLVPIRTASQEYHWQLSFLPFFHTLIFNTTAENNVNFVFSFWQQKIITGHVKSQV